MIAVLLVFCGMCGAGAGFVIAGFWAGAALLFGIPLPTENQVSGLALLFSFGSVIVVSGILACIEIFDL